MVGRKYLFIEGTKDVSNGDLREGFRKLLEKEVGKNMPTISMGEGKQQTIDKFLHSTGAKLLCDLDDAESARESDLENFKIEGKKDEVYYMIQEMEGWFLSQPGILDHFYGNEISRRLTKKHGSLFSKPDEELQRITRDSKRGQYHKVRHGVELLKLLDTKKLAVEFHDFKRLIENLKS